MQTIEADAATMIRVVSAGEHSEGDAMTARLAAIRTAGLLETSNEVDVARVAALTGVAKDGVDSLHRLVIDLHRGLTRLAADCSEEILEGGLRSLPGLRLRSVKPHFR